MGFFSGYGSGARVGGFLSGLGRLTAPGSSAPSKDAKRVVSAFFRGQSAQGACRGPKDAKTCDVVSTGTTLKVGSLTIASRPAPYSDSVKVCIPAHGEAVQLKSGKMVEAQGSKDVKAVSAAVLRAFKTGLGVRTMKGGHEHRITGAHGRAKVGMPGECLTISVNKHMKFGAGLNTSAELLASSRGAHDKKGVAAARKEILAERAATLATKRASALLRAREVKKVKASRAAASKRLNKMPMFPKQTRMTDTAFIIGQASKRTQARTKAKKAARAAKKK